MVLMRRGGCGVGVRCEGVRCEGSYEKRWVWCVGYTQFANTLAHMSTHTHAHTHTHDHTHTLTGLMKKHFLIIRRYYLRYMSGFDTQMVNHIALVRDTILITLQYHIHTYCTYTHTHTHKYTHLANSSVPR